MKLLRQGADSWRLENRAPSACPACGRAFDRLFVSEAPPVTFGSPPASPICLARTDAQPLLMTHPEDGGG